MQDPIYSLYFQPRNTYFLAQCPGAVLWHGGCGKSTPIGPDALSCRFNGLIATYGIMPEATGQESQQKGRHGELCLPTSATMPPNSPWHCAKKYVSRGRKYKV